MPKKYLRIVPFTAGEGVTADRKNCVVRALSNATGIPYDIAHNEAKALGRPDGKGTPYETIKPLYSRFGLSFVGAYGSTMTARYIARKYETTTKPGISLEKWLNQNLTGSYIVGVRGHHFAVVNGKIIDSFPARGAASVTGVWKVTGIGV